LNALPTLETSNVPFVGQGLSGFASFGILSTYPPTPCGLATFSATLSEGLCANGADVSVVRVADGCLSYSSRVIEGLDPASIWPDGLGATADWFMGVNDPQQLMWDPETGGEFDGLHAIGVNRNQGAEPTLAVLSTLQHARRFSVVRQ
jgi:hypothetical protein